MKKHNLKHLVLIVLLAMIMLIGAKCDLSRFGSTGTTASSIFKTTKSPVNKNLVNDFHQGPGGVEISIQKNNPPDTIFVGDNFQFIVELRNKGAVSAYDGHLYLVNYDPQIRINNGNKKEFELEGKTDFNSEGELKTFEFDITNTDNTILKKTAFTVSACYQYITEASLDIFIYPYPKKKIYI